jgi:hypothetical protein
VCGKHDSVESLLLSLRGSNGGLSHSRGVILLPLGGGTDRGGGLLLINREVGCAARHVGKTVVVVGDGKL